MLRGLGEKAQMPQWSAREGALMPPEDANCFVGGQRTKQFGGTT